MTSLLRYLSPSVDIGSAKDTKCWNVFIWSTNFNFKFVSCWLGVELEIENMGKKHRKYKKDKRSKKKSNCSDSNSSVS